MFIVNQNFNGTCVFYWLAGANGQGGEDIHVKWGCEVGIQGGVGGGVSGDDKGYWTQSDAYIRDRSEAEFGPVICPEGMKKFHPYFENT